MKRIAMIFMIIAAVVFMAACQAEEALPDYRDNMVELENPVRSIDGIWMSHELTLNTTETLYFAPWSFQKDGSKYTNLDREGYYKKTTNWLGLATWEKVSNEYLQTIFSEGA